MKRIFLVLTLVAGTIEVHADTIKKEILGCRDYDTYKRIRRTIALHREAGVAAMLRALSDGDCIMWREGTPVTRAKRGVFTGCYARVGTADCYWTPNSQVKR